MHPTQVYDSLLNLALYAGLAWLYRRKKFDGQVFTAHLIGYALLRSLVELFRDDYKPQDYYGGLERLFLPEPEFRRGTAKPGRGRHEESR